MRRTPPVVVQLLPQPAVQGVVAVLVLLAAAGLSAWACSYEARAWPLWLAVVPATAWGWRVVAVARRRLRWDGEAWRLSAPVSDDEAAVRLAVLIELDAWLPLSRRQRAQWGAQRATLLSAANGAVRQR